MLFEIKKVSKLYGSGKKGNRFTALSDVTLSIEQGQSIAIVGKSGSGKSTLMHILAALDSPTSGQIRYGGKKYSTLTADEINELRNNSFGFVFQQFYLNAKETVLENVALPLKIAGMNKSERYHETLKVLKVLGLEDKKDSLAADLSGGQKQRVCIARAIVNNPIVIFADEPTGNLDSESGKQVIDELFRLNKEGKTLIIVTHDEDLARLCRRRIRLNDGRVEARK